MKYYNLSFYPIITCKRLCQKATIKQNGKVICIWMYYNTRRTNDFMNESHKHESHAHTHTQHTRKQIAHNKLFWYLRLFGSSFQTVYFWYKLYRRLIAYEFHDILFRVIFSVARFELNKRIVKLTKVSQTTT